MTADQPDLKAIEQLVGILNQLRRYYKRIGQREQRFVPSYVLQMDGRTLRGLQRRGLLRLDHNNNGSRDPRYLSWWYDVTITRAGLELIDKVEKSDDAG